jgi:hypothetical protein
MKEIESGHLFQLIVRTIAVKGIDRFRYVFIRTRIDGPSR